MSKNVLLVVGSPRNKKGNSESLLDFLKNNITNTYNSTKIFLRKEINNSENLIKYFSQADYIVISFPIYQNSFPGLVLQLFEFLMENKNLLEKKQRKMIVISNSGFAETSANICSIEHCQLLAEQMGFIWKYGITVAPGTLIDGKDLSETGKIYKTVRFMLADIANQINTDNFASNNQNSMYLNPVINPFIYRIAGRLFQNKTIKKLGKKKYFQKPLYLD